VVLPVELIVRGSTRSVGRGKSKAAASGCRGLTPHSKKDRSP
jgi:hypothetical protein